MALLDIEDLFTALTAAEWRAKMVAELLVLGIPADKWRSGGVASTILTVASICLALMSSLVATIINGFFLPTATGANLKALAYYVYGVTVPSATFASGAVTLVNSGGGVYSLGVGEYTCLNPATGQTYVNTAAFVVAALGTTDVTIQAVNAGSAGSSNPNTITTNVTSLLGVSVNNAAAVVGQDAPTDDAVRQLCYNALAAQSVRGVRTVYAYAVQTAVNSITLAPVNINRWAISEADHTGVVSMVVASPSGPPVQTDIDGIVIRVEEVARPSGVTFYCTGASSADYTATIQIWAIPAQGDTNTALKSAIDTAISDYITAYPIGGITASDDQHTTFTGLFGEGITSAIAAGAATRNARIISVKGAADLALASDEVPVDETTTSLILLALNGGNLT